MLEISVLGQLEVRRDGEVVPIPGGLTAELLVRLALEAGAIVSTDRLIEDLWGDQAVDTNPNTLQAKVARLRRALGDASTVGWTEAGYSLAIDPAQVDALVVPARVAALAEVVAAGEDRAVVELCAGTLAMFRGDLLASAGSGDWVAPHRARLDELRSGLVEAWFAARLRIGDAGDVVGDLEAAVSVDPFHEALWGLLITALYRAGRQADALDAYQRVRAMLADELGLEPGPALRQLEQQILVHDAALAEAIAGPAVDLAASRGNLPSLAVELVGRDEAVRDLARTIADHRLVELVGSGGIGKTALAIATGRTLDLPGGVWLARLETASTAVEVADTLIAAMDVTGGEPALVDRLRRAETLVILDNCEHVVDQAAELATRLLDAAPGLRILCTSQVRLDVEGEELVELEPLDLSDAVELFSRRASAPRSGGDGASTRVAVEELCRSLDGLPLAIELAAARTRSLSITEITNRLDDRFQLLSDPTSRRPERRRALGATIRWSYDLLFPDDQRGLWALAAFSGGAPLAAVESVLEALGVPAPAAIDVIGRLVSRSLVIVDDGGAAAPRYRLLDSIRAFAREAMAEVGATEQALAAHASWYAGVARSSTAGVRSPDQADHLAIARAERANIDAALAWCTIGDPLLALEIVNGFGWAWIVLGDSRGAERARTALDAAGLDAPDRARAEALLLAGWIEASLADLVLARRHVDAAAALAEETGDIELRARSAYYLAYVVSHEAEFHHALELTDLSAELYAGLGRPWDEAANALFAARAAIYADDAERGAAALDEVDRLLEIVGDPWLAVRRDAFRGELARIEGRFDDAVVHIAGAAATSHRRGYLQTEAYQVSSLGRAQAQAGDAEAGAATLALAVDKAEAIGDLRMAALARIHLGRVLRGLDRPEAARTALEAAMAWHAEVGSGEQALLGTCLLTAMDDPPGIEGDESLATILEQARVAGDAPVEVFTLDAQARRASAAGDVGTARLLLDEADARMVEASHFMAELDRADARVVRAQI